MSFAEGKLDLALPTNNRVSVKQFRQRLEVSIELSDLIRMRWHVRGCAQSGLLSRTMRRFLRIFTGYALAAAVIFILQWSGIGAFLMFFFGIFWIGILVHVFMIHLAIMSISGALPRLILILPGAFYAAGLAVGLYSDFPALRWQSQQQWLQVDKQIPMDTHDLTFFDRDDAIWVKASGAFQPETLGFKLFNRGPDHPLPYVVIGGGSCADSSVIQFSSATIRPSCQPISLYVGRNDVETLGTLSGAHIRKRSYFLFPTAGCGLIDNPASWRCEWYVSPLWSDAYVGYYTSVNGTSGSAASILMSALGQLRGQPAPQ